MYIIKFLCATHFVVVVFALAVVPFSFPFGGFYTAAKEFEAQDLGFPINEHRNMMSLLTVFVGEIITSLSTHITHTFVFLQYKVTGYFCRYESKETSFFGLLSDLPNDIIVFLVIACM